MTSLPRLGIVLGLAFTLVAPLGAAAVSAVDSAVTSAAAEVTVLQVPDGWIVTDDPAKSAWAAEALAATTSAVKASLGIDVTPGVVSETRFVGLVDSVVPAERRWLFSWPTASFANRHLSEGDGGEAEPTGDRRLDERSSFRHELAHLLFVTYLVPNSRKGQYGGDAPDWLDEAAAMVAETPAVTSLRRKHFREQVCSGRLVPLRRFLASEHPVHASPRMRAMTAAILRQKPDQAVMLETTLSELGISRSTVADFYAQSKAIHIFLIERTGDQAILGRVARHIARPDLQAASWQDSEWFQVAARLVGRDLDGEFADWARSFVAKMNQPCEPTE